MASSLPIGAPNPPPRQPAASLGKRGRFRAGLSDLARGIPKASAQSTVLWSIGDLTCQKLEKRTSIDTRRLASNAAYGAVVLGPVGHLWYEGALVVFCERFIPYGGAAMVAAKLAFDLCVFGPAHLACFLGWSGFWSFPRGASPDDDAARGGGGGRKPSPSKGRAEKRGEKTRGEEAKGTLKAGGRERTGGTLRAALSRARASVGSDFLSGLVVDTAFWAPVQTANFAFVPVSKQLLYVNVACAVDAAILSWIASHPGALARMWDERIGAPEGGGTGMLGAIAEWCREHKLRAIGGVWLTGMGASMAYNATQTSLSPSVKVIHSRIYAQALTLTCLLGSAAAEWYDVKYNNRRVVDDDPYVYKPPQGTRTAPVGR